MQGGIAAKSLGRLACGTYYDKVAHTPICASVATKLYFFIPCKYVILQGWHSVGYTYITLVLMILGGPFLLDGLQSAGGLFYA